MSKTFRDIQRETMYSPARFDNDHQPMFVGGVTERNDKTARVFANHKNAARRLNLKRIAKKSRKANRRAK